MKKLFTLVVALMVSATIFANDTFQFCYKDGTVIPSGSTVVADQIEEDPFFGDKMLPSGIYVKNTSEDYANVNLTYTINSIPNGTLQVCFPENCYTKDKPGTYDNGTGELAPGEIRSMQTEWLPMEEGVCTATFTISEVSLGKMECSTITVKFQYGNVGTEVIWGYYTGDGKKLMGLGASATSYNVAIFVPGSGVLGGSKISGLKIPVADGSCVTKIIGWVADKLQTTMSYLTTKDLETIPAGQNKNTNDIYGTVTFDTPITVPAEGCYVGYQLTLSSISTTGGKYPLLLDNTTYDANGCFAYMNKNWDVLGSDYGVSGLQVVLQGVDQPAAAAQIASIERVITAANEEKEVLATIASDGSEEVKNIEYTVDVNGTVTTNTATVSIPAGFNKQGSAKIKIKAPEAIGEYTVKMRVTKVNGADNSLASNVTNATISNVLRKVDRNSVIEQFTGTTCGWCPAGHAAMHNLREAYGDRFIGIALHQYATSPAIDAMFFKYYRNVGYTAAPQAMVDGTTLWDANELVYGTGKYETIVEEFNDYCSMYALADINMTAKWANREERSVEVNADIEALSNGEYSVAYVLTADSLHGTGTPFRQTNYWSEGTPTYWEITDPTLSEYCKGGKYGQSYVFPYFMDVAVASSYTQAGINQADDLGTMKAGEKKSSSYTLTLPATPTNLVSTLDENKHNIYAIVLVFAPDGTIANAKRIRVTNDGLKGDANDDGVVDVSDITTIAAYILSGTASPFIYDNADVDGDGEITVADITATASIILGKGTTNHEYVDLGLPSKTLWATCNVGAEKPEDFGKYFAWGETVGYGSDTTDGHSFDWASYKWSGGTNESMTKYCTNSDYGTVDNKKVLDSDDDAATVNWGSDWCMPTLDQIEELINSEYTTTEWTAVNGVNGRKVTSKSNGNSIFLPAAGFRSGSSINDAGVYGDYKTRSLNSEISCYASSLDFNSEKIACYYSDRCFGFSVRPVRVQK